MDFVWVHGKWKLSNRGEGLDLVAHDKDENDISLTYLGRQHGTLNRETEPSISEEADGSQVIQIGLLGIEIRVLGLETLPKPGTEILVGC